MKYGLLNIFRMMSEREKIWPNLDPGFIRQKCVQIAMIFFNKGVTNALNVQ